MSKEPDLAYFDQLCVDYIGPHNRKSYSVHRNECCNPKSKVYAVISVIEGVAKFADHNGRPDSFIAPFLIETLLAARTMLNYDMGPVDKGVIDDAIHELAARLGFVVS